jgi:type IV pilus assembly protein PilA
MRPLRTGFTLIELLVVVVIIGVLAAIAIPKFQNSKGKANAAAMKSDLHGLAITQENYFYEKSTYAGALTDLNFTPTRGVTITITDRSDGGWAATSWHPLASPLVCGLYVGSMTTPPLTPMNEGVVSCQ